MPGRGRSRVLAHVIIWSVTDVAMKCSQANNTGVIDKFNRDVSNRRKTLSKLTGMCTVSDLCKCTMQMI